ncbi:MAG: hypothetical protein PHO63_05570 [Bacilli bacterium]|nr:hypothetical protein [Bacilli bacterium]
MKKYFLFTIFVLTLIVSCGKNDIPSPDLHSTEALLLLNYFSEEEIQLYNQLTLGTDTNFIYGYGFKDNKLYIKGFDKRNKQNILSFVSNTNIAFSDKILIDKGYGNVETFESFNLNISPITKYGNNYSFLINFSIDWCIPRFLYTISNGNEKVIELYPSNIKIADINIKLLNNWFESSFILASEKKIQCYNYSGNILYETNNPLRSIPIPIQNYFVLNIDECLLFTTYNNILIRYNAKLNIELWKSINPLPSNIRIDKTTFETIDNNFTKCTFNYTTYEGDKKVITFKINNNTGELVQL